MFCLYEMDPRFLPPLLAADRMDVADGTWPPRGAGRNLPINPDSRTIFIGLGGSGVKTLNQIKKEVQGRLQPGWERYVAFLAIDADWSELERAPYLTAEEFVCITRPDIKNTVEKGMAHYPNAWLPFVNEAKASEFIAFVGCDSACQRRLIGKMKLHYQAPGQRGVDEEIVARLEDVKTRLAPLNYGCDYEVYVIGGLCGGTGSGIVTELPALIHEALQIKNRTHIRSMFYLPDTLTALVTRDKERLMANGYAALKELNYYQGLYMRPEGKEVFPWNGIGGALELNQRDGFYTLPTLVGTPHGATPEAMKIARDQVAEYLVNLLVDDNHIRMRFEGAALPGTPGKAANPQMEEAEHAFPKCYSAMGFAKAAVPEKMVRAYVMGQVCRNAGFLPVSDVERAQLMAAGKNFLPFLGEKQYETATVVNAQCQEMLADLTRFMAVYHKGSFDYATVIPGGAPTWEAIHDGSADDSAVRNRVNGFVTKATDGNAAQALENAVIGRFRAFRDSVKAYVQVNGPMAFYNLYHGCTVPEKGKLAQGIREILRSMVDDINHLSGKPNFHANPDAKMQDKNQKDSEIRGQRAGIVDRVYDMLYGRRAMHAAEWEKLYNDAVNAAISARRRAYMLGRYGILKRCFLDPAEELCRQLWIFGKILETMSEACLYHGSQLEIQGAAESFAQVNIAGDHHALRCLQRQADIVAGQVDGQLVRKALMDSFFEDPEGWLEVEDKLIRRTGDAIGLKSEEMPVSARRKFDQCLNDAIPAVGITIGELLDGIRQEVSVQAFARDILQKLNQRSALLLNGDRFSGNTLRYLVYPRDLNRTHPEFLYALEGEARMLFGDIVSCLSDNCGDSILLYQLAAPFEIYKLWDLRCWEREYEICKTQQANGLHGMSPDVKKTVDDNGNVRYEERTSWFDYPAISYSAIGQCPDA